MPGSDEKRTSTGAPGLEARIVLRPIGVPLPLGLCALAFGSLVLSAAELGWTGPESSFELGILILAAIVPLQLVTAVLGFFARDPVAATGVGLLAAGWITIGVERVLEAPGDLFGVALLAIALALVIPAATASLSKIVLAGVIALTAVRFAASGLFSISDAAFIEDLAGILGLAVTAAALYAALALELEATGRPVLPMLRRDAGRVSVSGDVEEQLEGIEHEAGVRKQV